MTLTHLNTGLPRLWSYWEGETNPLIELCFETLKKHNPSFRVVSPQDIRNMGGGEAVDFTQGLPIPQRSDYLRLWLLYHFGGAWTDSDVVCLSPLDWLPDTIDSDLIGVFNLYQQRRAGTQLLASPFGCRAGSPLIGEALKTCKQLLQRMKNKKRVPYGATSVGLLSAIYKRAVKAGTYNIRRYEHWRYSRVPWYRARQEYNVKGSVQRHEFSPSYSPSAVMYHLTNVLTAQFKQSTREGILHSGTFASFLIAKSLGIPKRGLFGRAYELTQRFPQRESLELAEVGVFRGSNSRQLLQWFYNSRVHLIDPWDENGNEERYRATKDGRAFDSKAKRERVFNTCQRNVAFAGDRAVFHRGPSVERSADFADSSLDGVFIDAEHSEPAIKEDVLAWYPKVKPGGYIGGHDYRNKMFPGVTRGVDQWANNNNYVVEHGLDYTWFVRKR